MVYLIVGLDRSTSARWHDNVMASDVSTAEDVARARAAVQGVHLAVAATIGPYSSVEHVDPARSPAGDRARREAA
jgi:hypothetical protein